MPAHFAAFDHYEKEAKRLLALGGEGDKRDPLKVLVLPAYDFVVKAAHQFNVLDARGAIGVTERARFIGRVRGLAQGRRRGVPRAARGAGLPAAQEGAAALGGRGRTRASPGVVRARIAGVCTLVLAAHVFAGYPLVVVANRDEHSTAPPHRRGSGLPPRLRSSPRATTSPAARGSA